MEVIHQKHKTSTFAPKEDIISNMPDIVITNILDRLAMEDAVRTCVLSRNWRYKWTLLSKLVFDRNLYYYFEKGYGEIDDVRLISRMLLHVRGAITKFVLSDHHVLDDEDVNHWILFLSRKGIKDLTLKNWDEDLLKLPTHLFSCLELTHLKLCNACFKPPPSFHGFPNLLSLDLLLHDERSELGELFTGCPLLEILNLSYLESTGNVKLADITNLENLKKLSFSLCDLKPEITSSSTIFELLGSFPKLQELDLDFQMIEFTEDVTKNRSTGAFPCLKALKLTNIDLGDRIMLSCAFELIRLSPKLQTLRIIECVWNGADPPPAVAVPIPKVEYDTMGQSQLKSVVFIDLKSSANGVCLMKYILACSPFLKKIVIRSHSSLQWGLKLVTRELLKLQRAYRSVDIDYYAF